MILERFLSKVLGQAEFFTGMKIERDMARKTLKLVQTRHIDDLVQTFGLTNAHPCAVPMDTALDLSATGSKPHDNVGAYMSLVGSLLYLSVSTRPDIAYAASILSRYMSKPTHFHWLSALKVLRYLKGTRTYGLVYGNTLVNNGLQVTVFCDSNHAGDKADSQSTYGGAFMMNGAAFCWTSRKQSKVAHSTAEAEFLAASLISKEALWILKLMADLDLKGPLTIFMDNTCALTQIKENSFTPRNKHIGIHYHAVLERIRHEDVKFEFISTTENVADIFTKPLSKVLFERFRTGLGVME